MPSPQILTCNLGGTSKQFRLLHHHLILQHLDVKYDLLAFEYKKQAMQDKDQAYLDPMIWSA